LFIEPVDDGDDSSSFEDGDTLSTATWSDESSVGVERFEQLSLNSAVVDETTDETRATIDSYLQSASRHTGGLKLSLNKNGCCTFRYDGMSVVLDVPNQGGAFCFYTPNLVPAFAKNTEKHLASLQGQTRGGLLSTKKRGSDEVEVVIFSYVDNVNDISESEFLHILLNFVDTAVSLRSKLLLVSIQQQEFKNTSTLSTTTNNTTDSLAAKTSTTKTTAIISVDKRSSNETTGTTTTTTCVPGKEKMALSPTSTCSQ
jgi:hypothetical protein